MWSFTISLQTRREVGQPLHRTHRAHYDGQRLRLAGEDNQLLTPAVVQSRLPFSIRLCCVDSGMTTVAALIHVVLHVGVLADVGDATLTGPFAITFATSRASEQQVDQHPLNPRRRSPAGIAANRDNMRCAKAGGTPAERSASPVNNGLAPCVSVWHCRVLSLSSDDNSRRIRLTRLWLTPHCLARARLLRSQEAGSRSACKARQRLSRLVSLMHDLLTRARTLSNSQHSEPHRPPHERR